jgi:hypothetical protein
MLNHIYDSYSIPVNVHNPWIGLFVKNLGLYSIWFCSRFFAASLAAFSTFDLASDAALISFFTIAAVKFFHNLTLAFNKMLLSGFVI